MNMRINKSRHNISATDIYCINFCAKFLLLKTFFIINIYNLAAFMDGDIQDCIDHLIVAENAERMKEAEL